MPSVAGDSVYVKGLGELQRMFRRIEVETSLGMKERLKALAIKVRDSARKKASEQGFDPPGTSGRGTGQLEKKIGYSVRLNSALVRETAVSERGFPYPKVFEYTKNSPWPSRPFMEPALEENKETVYAEIAEMLDGVLKGSF